MDNFLVWYHRLGQKIGSNRPLGEMMKIEVAK